MAVTENAKKKWPLYFMGNQKWHLLCLHSFLYNEWKVLLHVINADGSCAMDFCHLKDHWRGLNPQTLGPMVSTLPRDHWCVPCDSCRILDNYLIDFPGKAEYFAAWPKQIWTSFVTGTVYSSCTCHYWQCICVNL
jgi:hypothetical protein